VAVANVPGAPLDHVHAMWSVFNSSTTKIRIAVSRDRGQTLSKPVTVTSPSQTGPSNMHIYPSVDAAGNLYIAFTAFPLNGSRTPATVYGARSSDDGQIFSPFVVVPGCCLPNTTFRDGITESFTANPTYPGHLCLTYEDRDGTQMDVKFAQSTDGGQTWSSPVKVNDNVDTAGAPTDQFQPFGRSRPEGGVAVVFYDRRLACPSDATILPADAGPDELLHRRLRLRRHLRVGTGSIVPVLCGRGTSRPRTRSAATSSQATG
jgi:hypothetical protein